jgi:hypothetical protein
MKRTDVRTVPVVGNRELHCRGRIWATMLGAITFACSQLVAGEVVADAIIPAPKVLFVVGSTQLTNGDRILRDRMIDLGFEVDVGPSNTVKADDALGEAVVVISDSVSGRKVDDKFRDVPVGLLVMEEKIFPDLNMTDRQAGRDFGDELSQTKVQIVDGIIGWPRASRVKS